MKRFTVSATVVLLSFLMLTPLVSFSQVRNGTVEASWKQAEKRAPYPAEIRTVPPVEVHQQQYNQNATAWEQKRSGSTHPWPYLPTQPTVSDYHIANTIVIDSLSHLYCLSPGYIASLRSRNDEAIQNVATTTEREFSYTDNYYATRKEAIRPSIQALHKELMQLLDRCTSGR